MQIEVVRGICLSLGQKKVINKTQEASVWEVARKLDNWGIQDPSVGGAEVEDVHGEKGSTGDEPSV